MGWILIFVFVLTIILSPLTTVPIIVGVILCLAVVFRNRRVFIAAFLGGLFIDLLMVRALGETSLFLMIYTFMIYLYQRRFEIQTIPFVLIGSFVGSVGYLLIFQYDHVLWQAVANALIALLVFKYLIRNLKFSMKSKFEN